jgi:hypothetical protein
MSLKLEVPIIKWPHFCNKRKMWIQLPEVCISRYIGANAGKAIYKSCRFCKLAKQLDRERR